MGWLRSRTERAPATDDRPARAFLIVFVPLFYFLLVILVAVLFLLPAPLR